MSKLGRAIAEQQQNEGITAKALAERMGIDPVILSRVKSGNQVTFEYKTILKMVRGIADDRAVRARLMAAYLSDLRNWCPYITPDDVEIVARSVEGSGAPLEDPQPQMGEDPVRTLLRSIRASTLTEAELDALRAIVENLPKSRSLRRVVSGLAGMVAESDYKDALQPPLASDEGIDRPVGESLPDSAEARSTPMSS